MINLTWSAFSQIVAWGQGAYSAARKKSEQRYARVVEHSAVLVSGVTTMNRQLQGLLQPLAIFEPAEWHQQRRTDHVIALVAFGNEEMVLPRLRTARSALRGLLVDCDDIDVVRTAGRILREADDLFSTPERVQRRVEEELYSEPVDGAPYHAVGGYRATKFDRKDPQDEAGDTYAVIGFAADRAQGVERNPEEPFLASLPELLEKLRAVDLGEDPPTGLTEEQAANWRSTREDAVWNIRSMASDLLSPTGRGRHYVGDERPAIAPGILFPAAATMQLSLGDLLAISQRVFPTMPSPAFEV